MEKIKQLMKLISIIVLFTIPASCDLDNEQIIIENGVNVGACDITLLFNASVVNVTSVTGGDMDVTMANIEHADEGWARIGAWQTNNRGLNGCIILADVTFNKTADVGDICSLIDITVNTLKDATPEGNPIQYTVEGCAIVVSAPPTTTHTDSNDDTDDGGGGGGIIHTPTPSPTATALPATPSAATTPAEEGSPVETTAPTPEKVTAFHTEPSSLPPLILSPIVMIIIVVIVMVFGIIRVLGITAQAKGETHAEAIASIKQAEYKKAITAIIGIIVVAAAIIAIILMM